MSMASLLPPGENGSGWGAGMGCCDAAAAAGCAGERRPGGVGESSMMTVSMCGGGLPLVLFALEDDLVRATLGVVVAFFVPAPGPTPGLLAVDGAVGCTKVGSLN